MHFGCGTSRPWLGRGVGGSVVYKPNYMCISTNNNPVERDKDEEELCQSHTPTERTGDERHRVSVNPIDYSSLDDDGGGVGGVMMMMVMVILKVVLFNKAFAVELIKHFALSHPLYDPSWSCSSSSLTECVLGLLSD